MGKENVGPSLNFVKGSAMLLSLSRGFSHRGAIIAVSLITANGTRFVRFRIFDPDGLWLYDGIGFSRHGNVKQTVLHLIDHSHQGLSARQLAEKLSVAGYAVLNHMHKTSVIDRLKTRKGFMYLSGDAIKKERQLSRLQSLMAEEEKPKVLSAQAAVYVLAEFIKPPRASFAQLSRAVAKKQVLATPEMIPQLFKAHHIKKRCYDRQTES